MKTMNILRMTMVCALLWCAGIQYAKAGDLLSKEDSLELVRLYQEYVAAKENAKEKELEKYDQLSSSNFVSDSLFFVKAEEIERLYEEEIEALKLHFEASLAANPHFAEVVRLRNLLKEYQSEMNAIESKLYSEESDEDDFEESEEDDFDSNDSELVLKFYELIRDNPEFIDYPEFLFEEFEIKVASSSDGRLRYYNNVYRQYRTDDGKVLVSWDKEENRNVRSVYRIQILNVNDKTIYLISKLGFKYFNDSEGSRKVYCYLLHAEAIDGQEITHPHIFETEDENGDLCCMAISYKDRRDELMFGVWSIRFNEDTRTIDVRKKIDVKEGDYPYNYYLIPDYITYSFNGEKFVKSSYENVVYATNEIITYIETGMFFQSVDSLLDKPLEALSDYFNDEEFSFSDKSKVEDMRDRIKREEPVAHILYLGAAEKGDAVAQYKLGKCYYHGYMGVEQKSDSAKIWFEKAASQGHSLAQQCLYDDFHDNRYKNASAKVMKDSPWKQELTHELQQFVEEREEAKIGLETFSKYTKYNRTEINYSLFQNIWEYNFIEFLQEHPKALAYPGLEIEKLFSSDRDKSLLFWDDFKVITSPDGLLRAYCWDCTRGFGMINRDYACIFQYLSDEDKTFLQLGYKTFETDSLGYLGSYYDINYGLKEEDRDHILCGHHDFNMPWEDRDMVTKIYQMDTQSGRFYLVTGYTNREQKIIACIINDGFLYSIPIFMVDGKKQSRMIGETYNMYSPPDDFITFDEVNKTITIQQYEKEPDEDGNYNRLDDIVYKFDGQFFRKVE